MGLAEDLKDLLTTGGFTSPIFVGEAPERPAACLAITPTGGLGPQRTMSPTLANAPIEHVRVQLRARAADYAACDAVMTAAYSLLSGLQERPINARRYHYAKPVQTPYYLGLDDASRPVIGVNFDVWRAEST
jgi:hypothetical protein